jgi:hypothetical protein
MSRIVQRQRLRMIGLVALLGASLSAAGCTSQIADLAEPAAAPARPAAAPVWPAVNDMPVARATQPMSVAERQRISDELSAAREHHETDRMEEIAGTDSTGAVKTTGPAAKSQSTTR